jgi:hypothetical protein
LIALRPSGPRATTTRDRLLKFVVDPVGVCSREAEVKASLTPPGHLGLSIGLALGSVFPSMIFFWALR